MTSRRTLLAALLAAGLLPAVPLPAAAAGQPVIVYKDASCGCCKGYIAYLNRHGIAAVGRDVNDIGLVKRMMRVPEWAVSCHTMVLGGYVVEGHVPMAALRRLLAERPAIPGIALPGMPLGAPGMNGAKEAPFVIRVLEPGARVFMTI